MLRVENLVTGYRKDPVIHGISFDVRGQSVVTVLGHNGAGKSSVVKALVGLIPVWRGKITLEEQDLTSSRSPQRIKAGIAVSFQDEAIFPTLTVAKNLQIGSHVLSLDDDLLAEQRDLVLSLFPKLRERMDQLAYTLSGGEARMLSFAMALMSDPKLLLLDEPSTGLSPAMTEHVMKIIAMIRDRLGKAVLLVEQNVRQALGVCDHVVVLKSGNIVYRGDPSDLSDDPTELIKLF